VALGFIGILKLYRHPYLELITLAAARESRAQRQAIEDIPEKHLAKSHAKAVRINRTK
jgi:hypothetical protein